MGEIDNKKKHYPMCGAKTRKNGRCKQHAMENGRCAWHGGKSLSGVQHGRYKHGYYSREWKEQLRENRQFMKMVKAMLR